MKIMDDIRYHTTNLSGMRENPSEETGSDFMDGHFLIVAVDWDQTEDQISMEEMGKRLSIRLTYICL